MIFWPISSKWVLNSHQNRNMARPIRIRKAGGNISGHSHLFHRENTPILKKYLFKTACQWESRTGIPEKWAQKIHPSGGGAPAVYRVYECRRYKCRIKSFRKATVYKRDSLLYHRPRVCSHLGMCVGTRGVFLRFAARWGRHRSRCTALPCTRILGC